MIPRRALHGAAEERAGDRLVYGTQTFHINGIRRTEAVGSIPVLMALSLTEQL